MVRWSREVIKLETSNYILKKKKSFAQLIFSQKYSLIQLVQLLLQRRWWEWERVGQLWPWQCSSRQRSIAFGDHAQRTRAWASWPEVTASCRGFLFRYEG